MLGIDLAEGRRGFLSETVRKVVVLLQRAEVLERQHGYCQGGRTDRLRSVGDLDIGDEAVSSPGNGLDECRRPGRIAENLTDLADGRVDAHLGVNEHPVPPEPFDDLRPRNQLATPLHEQDQ